MARTEIHGVWGRISLNLKISEIQSGNATSKFLGWPNFLSWGRKVQFFPSTFGGQRSILYTPDFVTKSWMIEKFSEFHIEFPKILEGNRAIMPKSAYRILPGGSPLFCPLTCVPAPKTPQCFLKAGLFDMWDETLRHLLIIIYIFFWIRKKSTILCRDVYSGKKSNFFPTIDFRGCNFFPEFCLML